MYKRQISTDVVKNPASLEQKKNINHAIIEFETLEHNFGDIMEGEKLTYAFKFKNTGKSDLVITSVSSTCGCTVTEVITKSDLPVFLNLKA